MRKAISFFTRLCEAYLPDAFVFCLILTLVVFLAALFVTPHSSLRLVEFWGKDFWNLHTFAMQMVFVLLTGHMLATAPIVKLMLKKLTQKIHSEKTALIALSLFSILTCWINWGFGLIVSGVLALELGRKLKEVNFGLFIATAYSGFLVWHGGLSGSIPLKIAGNDEVLSSVFKKTSIPLAQTVFSCWNLLVVVLLLITLPLLILSLRTEDKTTVDFVDGPIEKETRPDTLRGKLENSQVLNLIFFVFSLIVLFRLDSPFDINRINFIFLFLAILLHKTPILFLRSLHHSVSFTSGIIIQFPFYAGLMGLMHYSGLADQISRLFVDLSTEKTLPLLTFLSGGIVNFFVPSGGGQWVVQGPIVLKAAQNLGVEPAKVSLALAWGDAWTNMVQPFWALPLLAMARLHLKDIMGYCLIITLFSGLLIGGMLFFL